MGSLPCKQWVGGRFMEISPQVQESGGRGEKSTTTGVHWPAMSWGSGLGLVNYRGDEVFNKYEKESK